MAMLYISKQTEAEKDQYLFECFHDSGVIKNLLDSSYTILAGRKGLGKSAVARFLEKNVERYEVNFAYRLSVRNFNTSNSEKTEEEILESMLFFIGVKAVQKMINVNYFKGDSLRYWKDFLVSNGFHQLSDYESFRIQSRQNETRTGIKAKLSAWFAGGSLSAEGTRVIKEERVEIPTTPAALFNALNQSMPKDERVIIFIDDISDYLDESEEIHLRRDINVIKKFLLALQSINLEFIENGLSVRFVSLVRDDLFEYMDGSNVNKLKSDTLFLKWSEKDFCSLLIKRIPFFSNDIEKYLSDPVMSIKQKFPDEIFSHILDEFLTNRYGSNFYAYMAAISFNRPRDFLQFCYALRNRLSEKGPATLENIESAEIEYTDYFKNELRDELYITSRVFNYDFSEDGIDRLINLMSRNDIFNVSQLKSELSGFLGVRTSIGNKKIEMLLQELWRYGVIGAKEKNDNIIRFRYLSENAIFSIEKIKNYAFYLHRGLWWFFKKSRN